MIHANQKEEGKASRLVRGFPHTKEQNKLGVCSGHSIKPNITIIVR
jgi:hypothetical protein